jgi:NDP-sugar pyrophosphorylase family protein
VSVAEAFEPEPFEPCAPQLVGAVREVPRLVPTRAVILAGGRGTRLAPYTSVLPKPLMPIGERSILEIVVEQLARCGFTDITFCVGYLSHLIQAVFNNGAGRDVEIAYVHEGGALGTAGPLRLVDGLDAPFLVMNGDVLTELDYTDLFDYHQQSGNIATIATQRRTIKLDYGVLQLEAKDDRFHLVNGYHEKPEMSSTVSMGIYVLEPEALEYIPDSGYFDFPDLVQELLRAGQPVGAYLYDGLWLDIGRHEDFERANVVWAEKYAVGASRE